ncbi:MAG TPA: hypothetical protein VEB40_01365 [Flavipsychrobacter sp.]|nr:hypothetical protein [Flavipsychrobacter sp.]
MEYRIEPATMPESDMDRQIANLSKENIPGWGMDADPENDPTYPMKHRNGADYERLNYEKPEQQPVNVELLQSIERPGVSRVFGTSTPPSGLSGMLRRYAFKHSESTYAHWFPLVVADRINVIEGIVDDIKHGHFPNLIAERGWAAEWKYNQKEFIQNIAITTVVATAVIVLLLSNKKKKKSSFHL